MAEKSPRGEIWEDRWINTACGCCYNGCAVRVHRVNGVAVAIEGHPDTSLGGRGGLCGKSAAGLMMLHDPNRLNVPLRRTNPEKGLGVDPGWKEISWDEALDELTWRLKKIRSDNPEKLWLQATTSHSYGGWGTMMWRWHQRFGSHQLLRAGGGLHCGNGAHHQSGLVHASWSATADWRYTNYVLKWGSSKGTGSGHSMTTNARLRADAVARGAQEICFDPICNFAGGKATEWVPILPGTDTVVALAIANVLVNELGTYDRPFLQKKTNLPFLVDGEGRFVRDSDGKPLLWDVARNRAQAWDDQEAADWALSGSYQVNGVSCRPAFDLLQEHLRQFTPKMAAEASTVPAATIQRIAREFAAHASIGSTITIEGREFPYRPVASIIFRGGQGHTNSLEACAATDLLNTLVGAEDVPGGCLGWPAIRMGPGESGHFDMVPGVGEEGVVLPSTFYGGHSPWPIRLPQLPCKGGRCDEFWTLSHMSGVPTMRERDEVWQKLGMEARPEMLMVGGANIIAGISNHEDQLKLALEIPFVVQFDLFSNETAEAIADLLLPDLCYLERLDWHTNLASFFFNHPPTYEEWAYHPQIPVVDKPAEQRRNCIEVLMELTDRVGFRAEWNSFFNDFFRISDPAYRLGPEEKLTWEEIGDRVLKWCFGADCGLDYIKQHGYLKWPKKLEEVYWRWNWPSLEQVRIPVYREYLLEVGARAEKLGREVGLDLAYEQYAALPSHFPPASVVDSNDQYDLIAFSYRDILHTNSQTAENPWLDEISQLCPYTYTITINENTARDKGLQDGDMVWLETPYGKREKGRLKTMQGQHPRTVAIAGQAGLWAKGRPIARGKGSNFDKLLENTLRYHDPVTLNMETSVAVRVIPAD